MDTEYFASERGPPALPFTVIALGASAGGLEALRRFFTAMPPGKGIAFVVIVHLAPDRVSHFAEVLKSFHCDVGTTVPGRRTS